MERVRGNEYRTTVICVDSYEHTELRGRFYNPGMPDGEAFESLTQLLVKMEDMLDGMQLPQSFTIARGFAPVQGMPGGVVEERGQTGALATFAVRILFRQNASWQGAVSWLEGKREQSFRSALELIFLMDSALRGE